MATVRAVVCNKKGLHARAAAKLVKLASGFAAKVEVTRLPYADEAPDAGAKAGATSILSLLMLAAEKGSELELSAEGDDAAQALQSLGALIERKFDEEE